MNFFLLPSFSHQQENFWWLIREYVFIFTCTQFALNFKHTKSPCIRQSVSKGNEVDRVDLSYSLWENILGGFCYLSPRAHGRSPLLWACVLLAPEEAPAQHRSHRGVRPESTEGRWGWVPVVGPSLGAA